MKHLTNDVLCLVAAGRQVAQEQAAFARKMADIAITLQREICCLRRQATEIYSAQDRQIRTYRPSPEVLENLQRYERCRELRQSLLGRHDGSNAVEEFVRNDLRLWRTKRDAQRALMEAAEEALLTQAIEDLPATDDPFRAIQREIRRGYRARMPTFLPLPAQASEPKHAYWHGTLLSRRITAAVSLEQVCREIGLSKIETAVLVARFDGRWHSWPEAERLFNLKPGSLEPLRKRLSYYRDWLVDELGLRQLLSNRYRMNKN